MHFVDSDVLRVYFLDDSGDDEIGMSFVGKAQEKDCQINQLWYVGQIFDTSKNGEHYVSYFGLDDLRIHALCDDLYKMP